MPDGISVLWYTASIAAIAEGLRKFIVNRRSEHEVSRDYLALSLLLASLSLAVGAPASLSWIDHVTGEHSLAATARDVLQLAAVTTAIALLRVLEQTRLRIRTSAALVVVCATAMIVLYLLGGRTDPEFGSASDPGSLSRAYALIHLSYVVAVLVLFALGLWRVARRDELIMRVAINIAVAGVLLAVSGMAWRLAITVSGLTGPVTAHSYMQFALVAEPSGVILFGTGSALVATIRYVYHRRNQRREARQREGVDKLWAMLEPARADLTAVGERRRPSLQQKVVAIFDARIMLRTDACPAMAGHIAATVTRRGIPAHRATLVVEAVELRVLLDRHLDAPAGAPGAGQRDSQSAPDLVADVDAGPEESFVFVDERQEMANLAALAEMLPTPLIADLARSVKQSACGNSDRAA